MTKPTVLILDDDELWLARHERRLTIAGFKCRSTLLAKEAINWGKSDSSIKFALIDEILYVPPIPFDEKQRELQRWQGSGVIREITQLRSDIQFIVVTSAPQLLSKNDNKSFSRETARLRRQRGVIDVIHKQDIEYDPDSEYQWLLQYFDQPLLTVDHPSIMPRVLIGLGFSQTEYEAMMEQIKRKKSNYIPLSAFREKGNIRRILTGFLQGAKEKCVFIETPGSKKLDRTEIKSNTQSFKILELLAKKSELQEDIIISQNEYKYSPRSSRSHDIALNFSKNLVNDVFSDNSDDLNLAEQEKMNFQAEQDFAFEYKDGTKGLRTGVQLEMRSSIATSSPLKVEIKRLKEKLARVNVASPQTLFTTEQGSYRPNFKLGIILYQVKITKRRH